MPSQLVLFAQSFGIPVNSMRYENFLITCDSTIEYKGQFPNGCNTKNRSNGTWPITRNAVNRANSWDIQTAHTTGAKRGKRAIFAKYGNKVLLVVTTTLQTQQVVRRENINHSVIWLTCLCFCFSKLLQQLDIATEEDPVGIEEAVLDKGQSSIQTSMTDHRCSQNLSQNLRPVSPMYDREHGRKMICRRGY